MDSTQLKYFKAIAETGSLTRAAEQLHISQPAMSAMLRRFEEELQVELFERTPNRIRLNAAGEAALVHASAILQSMERMKDDLRSLAQQAASLAVGFCDPGVQWYCVPRLALAHPNVKFEDHLCPVSDAARKLADRTLDAVVLPAPIRARGVQSVPFLRDRVFLCVPEGHSLYGRAALALEDIPAQALLLPDVGGYFSEQIVRITAERCPQLTLVHNDLSIISHLIRTTNFLATISTLSVELRNDGPGRTLVPLTDPELQVEYHVCFLKTSRSRLEPLLRWCRAERDRLAHNI